MKFRQLGAQMILKESVASGNLNFFLKQIRSHLLKYFYYFYNLIVSPSFFC